MANVLRVYWDACAWIAYIAQEKSVDIGEGNSENRYAMCAEVLRMAQNNKIEIVTSAFTLAEVCKNPEVKDDPLDNLAALLRESRDLVEGEYGARRFERPPENVERGIGPAALPRRRRRREGQPEPEGARVFEFHDRFLGVAHGQQDCGQEPVGRVGRELRSPLVERATRGCGRPGPASHPAQ